MRDCTFLSRATCPTSRLVHPHQMYWQSLVPAARPRRCVHRAYAIPYCHWLEYEHRASRFPFLSIAARVATGYVIAPRHLTHLIHDLLAELGRADDCDCRAPLAHPWLKFHRATDMHGEQT